ncbi:glycosyltransferase WbuB [Dissulfurispira thermophila]|uniref:Glycosyltransferase WbuB n=2 Tax=root TaxID=1 RepID=A0A7G1H115_9BACT|nr:glycosyltransferase family 4 protein [Dissulfurispira thermophila]BCB96288.1 glycosyltransferase WbuB [Dissulfurispira thermophila]
MNILIITDSYPPEIRSASHLMQELAEGLNEKGFNVFVATTYPEYNLSKNQRGINYPEFTEEKNIKALRIKTLPHHNVNFIIRGISQLTMPYIFSLKIKKYITHVDFIIVYSPPLTLANLGASLKQFYKAKFILNVQDIFPQNAIDLGILKNRLLIKFFQYMEKQAYKGADVIFVHSENNERFLRNKHPYISKKLIVLHNWINTREFESFERKNYFRKLYGLENKFIILFAGVMGPSQGLDFVIELAERIQDIDDLVFLFVGDGMERKKLEEVARKKNLKNIIFKSFVSKEDYPLLVKDCDVGLVCLADKNKTPVVPGKILGYMGAGIPVLAFLNKESDGHLIIKKAGCGYSCLYGNYNEAENLIRKLYDKKQTLGEIGKKGLQYVKKNFDRDICIEKLINYFK